MTTTSKRLEAAGETSTGSPAAGEAAREMPSASAGRRFAEEIVRLHETLSFGGLPDSVEGEPLSRLDSYDDGLTTVSVRESQLPQRYLRGVMGFRLAQFLRMGWMDRELAYRRALFSEPVIAAAGPETVHTVTLTETGRIAGYIALVGSPDSIALPLDSPRRGRFPAEDAHRVDLLTGLAAPGRDTHRVYEVKRFVRDRSMAKGAQRERVPWHLILSLGRTTLALGVQVILGDSRENGALRHLRLMGFDPVVIDGTAPTLPRTELMWPSYEQPELAKPFVGAIPDDFAAYLDAIESGLVMDTGSDWQGKAIARLVALHRAAGRLGEDASPPSAPTPARTEHRERDRG